MATYNNIYITSLLDDYNVNISHNGNSSEYLHYSTPNWLQW